MRGLLRACVCLAVLTAACGAPASTTRPEPTPTPAAPPDVGSPTPTPMPTLAPLPAATPIPTPTADLGPAGDATMSAQAAVSDPSDRPLLASDTDHLAEPVAQAAPMLNGLLDGLLPDAGADYALVIEDLASGARTGINDGQTFPSASLYKLGVAWVVLRQVEAGTLELDTPITIEDEDAVEPEPYGGVGIGDTRTVRDAIGVMLSHSSNAAAHALLRVIGRNAVNQELDRIGLSQTRVPIEVAADADASSDAFPVPDESVAVTSAADMARLLRLIATSPELGPESRAVLAQGMASIAPPDALRDTLPDTVGVYDKTGNLDDASNVGALLETPRGTAILVVIDTRVNPGDARAIIGEAGQIAYKALLE